MVRVLAKVFSASLFGREVTTGESFPRQIGSLFRLKLEEACMSLLYYVHDPMCSWCWAFRPTWQAIAQRLPEEMEVRRLVGGLAPDSDQSMPAEMQEKLQRIWTLIQRKVPGTQFNFDFWSNCQPRRSTYPACRAVIAARLQGEQFEEAMIYGIQRAYYLQARNPSDESTLVEVAVELGMNGGQFQRDLASARVREQFMADLALGRSMGADSFPSLVLERDGARRLLQFDYLDPEVVLRQLES
jgi:putative protein-disulfide isomerase